MSLFLLNYSIDMIVSLGKGKIRKWVFIITSWTYCRIEQTLKQVPKWQINIQNIYSALEKKTCFKAVISENNSASKMTFAMHFFSLQIFSLAKMRRLWLSDREMYSIWIIIFKAFTFFPVSISCLLRPSLLLNSK
jgi:hypothetical protein